MVEGHEEDAEGVEGEAQEECVAEDALVAVLVDVEEGVEVPVLGAGEEEFAAGQGEGQVGQGVEEPRGGLAQVEAAGDGEEEPVQGRSRGTAVFRRWLAVACQPVPAVTASVAKGLDALTRSRWWTRPAATT